MGYSLDHFGGIDGDLLKWICWYGDEVGGRISRSRDFFSSQTYTRMGEPERWTGIPQSCSVDQLSAPDR